MIYEPYMYSLLPEQQLPFAFSVVDYPSRYHWHTQVEVLVGRSGTCSVIIDDESYTLDKDTMIVIAPRENHAALSPSEGADWYVLQLDRELLGPKILGSVNSLYTVPFINGETELQHRITRDDCTQLFDTFDMIVQLFSQKGTCYEMAVYASVFRLFSELFHYRFISLTSKNAQKQRDVDVLQPALTYIHAHFSERISISDMLGQTYICKAKFSKLFKNVTGTTFIDYVNRLRIVESKTQLAETNKSISEVAINTGFNSPSYFNKTFREYCGMSPKEYRAAERKRRLVVAPSEAAPAP